MSFDSEKPYNDLPLLPPKVEIENKATLKKAISAGRALAELKGLGETIPNQAILVNSIILQEAKASSEIENTWQFSKVILSFDHPSVSLQYFINNILN